jgi:hypothetical protein
VAFSHPCMTQCDKAQICLVNACLWRDYQIRMSVLITKVSCPSLPTINSIYNINIFEFIIYMYGNLDPPHWRVGGGCVDRRTGWAGGARSQQATQPPAHQSCYTPAVLLLTSWWHAQLSRGVWVVSPKLPSTSPQCLFCTYYICLPSWLCPSCCTPWCPTTCIVSTCTCCCGLWWHISLGVGCGMLGLVNWQW